MKISVLQLEMVISMMKYELLGYGDRKTDLAIDIDISQEDPGTGAVVQCLTIKGVKPPDNEAEGETRMEVEIYPEHEKQEPRASKINTYKITKNY